MEKDTKKLLYIGGGITAAAIAVAVFHHRASVAAVADATPDNSQVDLSGQYPVISPVVNSLPVETASVQYTDNSGVLSAADFQKALLAAAGLLPSGTTSSGTVVTTPTSGGTVKNPTQGGIGTNPLPVSPTSYPTASFVAPTTVYGTGATSGVVSGRSIL